MRQYLVTFHKVVPDDCGHDHRALQQHVVVTTGSEIAAASAAKAMFCECAGVVDCRLRADTCEIVELSELAA